MAVGLADWDDNREEIKMVFSTYPNKYFQCKDFTDTLGLALDRAYIYLEQLREEGFLDLSEACAFSNDENAIQPSQTCGEPIHDNYYKRAVNGDTVAVDKDDGWFGLEKPNEPESRMYRLEVD